MADQPVTVVARIRSKPGNEERVREELLKAVAPTHAEADCINYDMHQSADDACLFMFYENWASKEALDEHLKTPHLTALIEVLPELLAEPIDLSLWSMISTPK